MSADPSSRRLQAPFDVAVVVTTRRAGTLAAALRSVFAQTFAGRVQVIVGVDGPHGDRAALDRAVGEAPPTMAVTAIDPGYSTSRSQGGVHAPADGGSLRAALTLLANARRVAYLSERNRYAPEHLDSLLRAIGDRAWAHSLRWFVEAASGQVLCRDEWDSVGPGRGIYAQSEGGYAAPDTLLVDKLACAAAIPAWTQADAEGRGEDRRFFRAIRGLPHSTTGEPSVYQPVRFDRLHPFLIAQFRRHGVRIERYLDLAPQVAAEVDRAEQAIRAQAEAARGTLSVQGVDFAVGAARKDRADG